MRKRPRASKPVPLPAKLKPKERPEINNGKIRTGQTKPFHKSTNIEVEQRIEAAYLLLAQRRTEGQIKATFEKEYNLAYRQTLEYITRARKRIAQESGKPKEQHAMDCLTTYVSLIRDPRSKSSDKIAANKGIVDMLGLKAPTTVTVGAATGSTDAQGQPQAGSITFHLTMDPKEITG